MGRQFFDASPGGSVPYRWAILQVRVKASFLFLRYTDSLGKRRVIKWNWQLTPLPDVIPPPDTPALEQLAAMARQLLDGLPGSRPGPHNTGPVPLAFFVSPPREDTVLEDELFRFVARLLDPDRVQVVRLGPSSPFRRGAFSLPFRILALGSESSYALTELEKSWWYFDEVNRQFGMHIERVTGDPEPALRRLGRDIIVTSDLEPVLWVSRNLRERRPRLIIVLDQNFPERDYAKIPGGIALLRLPPNGPDFNAPEYLSNFIHGLIHDLPLHEAVKAATRKASFIFNPHLTADPNSNQSLRILEALSHLKREGERWEASLPNLTVDSFLQRLPPVKDARLEEVQNRVRSNMWDVATATGEYLTLARSPGSRGRSPVSSIKKMRDWVSETRGLPQNFTQFEMEGQGLAPMASMEAKLKQLQALEPALLQRLRALTENSDVADLLRKHQHRVVDFGLSRLDTSPVLESVSKSQTLAAGARYELRIHVGNSMADSIVVGPTRPIDPLLPDPEDAEGYILEVLIQGKRFSVHSRSTQALRLPVFGGSEPVYFRVSTPKEHGPAQLRICIYYRNHLLQSFLLSAEITSTEEPRGGNALKVALEFSRTESFGNIEEFQPRSLCIGVNQGAHTHEVVIKGENTSQEFTFFPVTYEPEVDRFRAELADAVRDPASPQKARAYPPVALGQAPSNQVADCIRSWARIGRALYSALLNKASSTAMRTALFNLKKSSDRKIQIVRFDENFVFPWMLLYDYLSPEEISGAAPAPVCLGSDASGVPCLHSHEDQVFCVKGFWGIRHYVEELIRRTCETATTVPRQSKHSIRFVGDPQLNETSQLATDLMTAVGAGQFAQGPNDRAQLLDLLWQDPSQRPCILILLAHLETQVIAGQPKQSRLVLDQNQWLTQENITNKRSLFLDIWSQPRPIVFLGACQSAATSVKTINDFVTAWHGCGAAAVVGTEAVVGSDLAAQFAREVGKDLWNGKPLGEAVTEFRRGLIRNGNVLAFLFQAFGDVDLTIQ